MGQVVRFGHVFGDFGVLLHPWQARLEGNF